MGEAIRDRTEHSYSVLCCRPYGTVRLNIRTTWIQNASPEHDAMTEGSYMSSLGRQSLASSAVDTDSMDQIDQVQCRVFLATHALCAILEVSCALPWYISSLLVRMWFSFVMCAVRERELMLGTLEAVNRCC